MWCFDKATCGVSIKLHMLVKNKGPTNVRGSVKTSIKLRVMASCNTENGNT